MWKLRDDILNLYSSLGHRTQLSQIQIHFFLRTNHKKAFFLFQINVTRQHWIHQAQEILSCNRLMALAKLCINFTIRFYSSTSLCMLM